MLLVCRTWLHSFKSYWFSGRMICETRQSGDKGRSVITEEKFSLRRSRKNVVTWKRRRVIAGPSIQLWTFQKSRKWNTVLNVGIRRRLIMQRSHLFSYQARLDILFYLFSYFFYDTSFLPSTRLVWLLYSNSSIKVEGHTSRLGRKGCLIYGCELYSGCNDTVLKCITVR